MQSKEIKKFIKSNLIKTPCYIADLSILGRHIEKMQEIIGTNASLCYAMKANPFLTQYMDNHIQKIEVCSPGELEICIANNIPGADIIFSGVNKTEENIARAMEYGVDIITFESVKHFNLVKDYCYTNGKSVKALIRLSSGAQFGMSLDELKGIIQNRDEYPYLSIVGIHYFTGTQKKQISKIVEEIDYIDSIIRELKAEFGYECKQFEYGPGLAVPYFIGEDFNDRYNLLNELIEYVKRLKPSYDVTFELGRFFVAESMQYLTTIEDIKHTDDTNVCIVDGGIHHLNYYGQNMAMRVPRIEVLRQDSNDNCLLESDEANRYWKVCGSLCTFADVLVRKAELGNVSIGDVLVFCDAGAYSITEAPALFLSRKMPNIYIYNESSEIVTVRKDLESYEFNL